MSATPSHSESIVPDPVINVLRVPRMHPTSSGFRNVYHAGKNGDGVDLWRARVKLGQRLFSLPIRSTHPHVVALYVAAWYMQTFGPAWQALVRTNQRRENPWRVWYSASRGGWLARVWVRGLATEVVELTASRPARPRRNGSPLVFRTRGAARRGLRAWMLAVHGERWRELMYRTDSAPRLHPRKVRATTCMQTSCAPTG